jgi:AP endonuclease-1
MNHPDFQHKPMVLETPIERKTPDGKTVEDKQVWADEIKLLESLVGMDPDTKEFARLEAELQDKGAEERRRIQEQVDKKATKGVKKKRGSKVKKEETSDEESG